MFGSLIKSLFSSSNKKQEPNYFYFEDSRKSAQEMQQQAVAELQSSLLNKPLDVATKEEKHQKAFYDFLFGQSPPTSQHDELSLYLANKITDLLAQPNHILDALPILPMSLSKVIEQLNNDEFDTQVLVDLIEHEPVIAAKVIELANSSYYNHSDKEITELKKAFMVLGANGLMEGVINGFISKMTPHSEIYFKQYGNKIWQHSFSTGVIAKALIKHSAFKKDMAQAYFIGLICNLGDMIIFQLLLQAFAFVHPDCQPNSFAFKDLMFKNSKKLTYSIAKYWRFPRVILEALALQTKLTKSTMLGPLSAQYPLACYVYEANILSELALMYEAKQLDKNTLKQAEQQLIYSEQAKEYLQNTRLAQDPIVTE